MNEQKLRDLVTSNSFAKFLGIELLELEKGYARGRMRLEDDKKNIYGSMHGGCSYSLADTVAGIASATYGNYVTTLDGSMNYLLPVADTEYVYCEAKEARQGGTIGVYDVKITNDRGELLCTGTFNYFRLDKKLEN